MSAPAPPDPRSPAPEPRASGFRLDLPAYAGPLDLLLHLVKRHEIDLHDIPIATLTQQYLHHLQAIRTIDVDRAGDFLVMAATLLEIKSQLIIPQPERDPGAHDAEGDLDAAAEGSAEPGVDPRAELVQQLLAYKRFKDAANELERREAAWAARYPVHAAAGEDRPEGEAEIKLLDLADADVLDLCEAFGRLLDSVGDLTRMEASHDVTYDDTPISLHAADIEDRLEREPGHRLTLRQLFEGRANRSEMIGLFLATLELVRQRKILVDTPGPTPTPGPAPAPGGELQLLLNTDAPDFRGEGDNTDADDEPTDWTDPATGEVTYDWPDPRTRRRYERRQRLRAEQEED